MTRVEGEPAMRSQSIVAYGQALAEIRREAPQPVGSEVVLAVRHCGVCHSDLHLQDGFFDLGQGRRLDVTGGRTLPFTLGHEIEGEVVACGPEAHGIAPGARRVAYPWIGCGTCEVCDAGEEHLCARPRQLGITVDGGYATHVVVPHPRYLLDHDGIEPALAAACMCSGLTAFSALKRLGERAARGPILIVGLGGVGMMGLAFALALFGEPPLVADPDPTKREAALARGAAAAFDPAAPDARKAFVKATGGVHAAVDFAGTTDSLGFATGALRKGGKVVVTGMMGGAFSVPVPMLPMRALAIEGSFVGSLAEAREMLALVAAGAVAPIPLSTLPLAEANRALALLRAGRVIGRLMLAP